MGENRRQAYFVCLHCRLCKLCSDLLAFSLHAALVCKHTVALGHELLNLTPLRGQGLKTNRQ